VAALHEIEVELFRNRPELARELLRLCAGLDVGDGRAELGSVDVTQVISAEFRADAVTLIRDARGEPTCAIVVEIQRSVDDDKRLSWPVYVTGLRAKLDCPVILLVVVPDQAVAAWARRPIDIGHPGFSLRPVCIAHGDLPPIMDVEGVPPELVLLSAIAHPEVGMVRAVASILDAMPAEKQRLYLTMVLAVWPPPLRHLLEAVMRPELEAEIKELMYKVGHETGVWLGREQGLEQGRQEGRQQGHIEGLQRAALQLARERGLTAEDAEQQIVALTDPGRLTNLIVALGRARDADGARAALGAM
jgi:hypothetical protein